jgi:hypothetical protein
MAGICLVVMKYWKRTDIGQLSNNDQPNIRNTIYERVTSSNREPAVFEAMLDAGD